MDSKEILVPSELSSPDNNIASLNSSNYIHVRCSLISRSSRTLNESPGERLQKMSGGYTRKAGERSLLF